jgi:hypothetical protein
MDIRLRWNDPCLEVGPDANNAPPEYILTPEERAYIIVYRSSVRRLNCRFTSTLVHSADSTSRKSRSFLILH